MIPAVGRVALNEQYLLEGKCFGCGSSSDIGLRVKVFSDPDDDSRIVGSLSPSEGHIGFPGITHGGVVFTALDCMATWAGMILAPGPKAIWVLRSAEVTYRRPALAGEPLQLSATIPDRAAPGAPQVAHNEARTETGELLVRGKYKIVPLTPERFMALLGLQELPADWAAWLSS